MITRALRCIGAGLLAFLVGPLVGLVLGKAGIIYGIAGTALYVAGRKGYQESTSLGAAQAGLLTMMAPALAAGLPARWIAEMLFFNRYITWGEQVKVSAFAFLLLMALGAIAGGIGGTFRRQAT